MSLSTLAKSLLGRKGLGLRHEAPRRTDRVWMGGDGGTTQAAAVREMPAKAEGYVTLEPHCPPVGDQQQTSKCVGEAIHVATAIVESVYDLPYDPISPDACYRQSVLAHTLPGALPVDEGTYIRVALSEMSKKGCATLAEWSRRNSGRVMEPVPSPLKAHGYNRRGLRYEFIVARDIEEELDMCDAAIAQHRPIVFGWAVTERYMAHRGDLPFDARVRKTDVVRGGHAQVQITQRDEFGIVRLRNSWGTRWGDGGNINVIGETMLRRDLCLVSGWERLCYAT